MRDNAVLVTGAAGFIGFHVAQCLLFEGREIVGLDIVNSYYDPVEMDCAYRSTYQDQKAQ
jgi:UDP-glucuronate 4-epimerase